MINAYGASSGRNDAVQRRHDRLRIVSDLHVYVNTTVDPVILVVL